MIPHTVYTDDSRVRYRFLRQDTDEFWKQRTERQRFVSASEVPTVCGHGWQSSDLADLLEQKRTGIRKPLSDFVQEACRHGKYWEPYARRWFELQFGVKVQETGLWVHPVDQRIAASPDGLFLSAAGHVPVEFKCPYRAKPGIKPERVHKDSLQLQTAIQCCDAPYGVLVYYWHDQLVLADGSVVQQPQPTTECYLIENNHSHWLQIVAHVDWFLSLVADSTAPLQVNYSQNRLRYAKLFQHYIDAARKADSGTSLHSAGAGIFQLRSGKRGYGGEESAAGGEAVGPTPKRAATARTQLDVDLEDISDSGSSSSGHDGPEAADH